MFAPNDNIAHYPTLNACGNGHKRDAIKLPYYQRVCNHLFRRELGLKTCVGYTDRFISTIYNSFDAVNLANTAYNPTLGGIFNLEFSLDGKLLVAACEGKQVLLFDAGNRKLIKTLEYAHINCVNCIKFLNDNLFATGSDDTLIKLWDIRNLKSSNRTLLGHSSWVKNIEWSEKEQVMVSSAFDGAIYTWNLEETNENVINYERVFQMTGLMRMKLTPDGTKMVICTTTGYMIIIHDLHLPTLAEDFREFKPGMYRIMQLSHQSFPVATNYNHLFYPNRKRNRVEFIDEFPNNDAEIICSLQIHPHGWNAVSRHLTTLGDEEWTTVHDIQEREPEDYKEAFEYVDEDEHIYECLVRHDDNNDEEEERITEQQQQQQQRPPTDLWMNNLPLNVYQNQEAEWRPQRDEIDLINSGLIDASSNNDDDDDDENEPNKIMKNIKRLTHVMKEQNVGKGFIKVLSFSSDGRIIASPYGKGVRLLGFSTDCREASHCVVADRVQELKCVVEMNDYHRDIVVSCRFSPTHLELVTGCLGSQIRWYQPVL